MTLMSQYLTTCLQIVEWVTFTFTTATISCYRVHLHINTSNNHHFSISKIFVLQTWKYASVPQQEFSAACESGETSRLDGEVSGGDDHDFDNTMIHKTKSEIFK